MEKLLTTTEVMDLLGISIATLRRKYREGELPYVKFGQKIRFKPRDVQRYVDNHYCN
jgi:excisionase family DNA binding protein